MTDTICSTAPVSSVAEAIDRMEEIAAALPPSDGVACFNRMYLGVTQSVGARISVGFFEEPEFMETTDVQFANLYFAAVTAPDDDVPVAWSPLFTRRSSTTIHPMQFAVAGMNAHINHDLPIAVVRTCTQLDLVPTEGPLHRDYQKIDVILDEAEQAVRQSFESARVEHDDTEVERPLDKLADWTISDARDMAWHSALILWRFRNLLRTEKEIMEGMAKAVAKTSRALLD